MDTEKKQGSLKLYFSYKREAGASEKMLEDALSAKKEGRDVYIGCLRKAPGDRWGELLDGRKDYRRLNLDGVLKRRPGLTLIDGLAHRNKAEDRHENRYQDVEELLRAGIDVWATLQVSELEGLNDVILSINGRYTKNTIPDRIFDQAADVEFVDQEPEKLLNAIYPVDRDREGNHIPGLETERKQFLERLEALREAAVRRLVNRFNRLNGEEGSPIRARTGEQILVCLSGAPSNGRVIRAAARMAEAFQSRFTAIYVSPVGSPEHQALGVREANGEQGKYRSLLEENIRLAEELGARIVAVYGDDPAVQIAEYARMAGVSRIVLGKNNTHRLLKLGRKNLVERLMRQAPGIDIYIIPDTQDTYWPRLWRRALFQNDRIRITPKNMAKMAIIGAITSLAAWCFYSAGFGESNVIMFYLLGVLFTVVWTSGWICGALFSLFSVIVFNYLFTEPRFTLHAYDPAYPVTFFVMLAASFITSSLTIRVKHQAMEEARKSYRMEVLLETSQGLQKAETLKEVIDFSAGQLCRLMGRTVIFYPVENGFLAAPHVCRAEADSESKAEEYMTDNEAAVAKWVLKNNKYAGATTRTLPGTKCLYLAVRGQSEVLAVAGIAIDPAEGLAAYEKNLLIAMVDECGLVMEKHILSEEKKQAQMAAERESLRANLLRAISHDLRTPLTGISGNAGLLMKNGESLSEPMRQKLYTDIYDDASWLTNLVENLLSVTRIENGTMDIRMQSELLDDVFHEAVSHLDRRASEHRIKVSLEDDLLMARMDARLIIQVIINIMNNAVKYTQAGSVIELSGRRKGDRAVIRIADDGPGVPDEAKPNLFDMFFTAGKNQGDSRRGLGLGLSLCKSIVNAHEGELTVGDNNPHGAVFTFTLPIAEADYYE